MEKRIRWAPKLQPQLLRKLYQSYAMGFEDTDLIDDVGIRLFLRCESIVMIAKGEFFCPGCGGRRKLAEAAPTEAVMCKKCGFTCTTGEVGESSRHLDLWQGNAGGYFEDFYSRYTTAKTPGEKMILIDTLIHSFHIDAKSQLPNRAAGNNLIEGSLKQVVDLLDELSGVQPQNDDVFRETAAAMWERRRGGAKEVWHGFC